MVVENDVSAQTGIYIDSDTESEDDDERNDDYSSLDPRIIEHFGHKHQGYALRLLVRFRLLLERAQGYGYPEVATWNVLQFLSDFSYEELLNLIHAEERDRLLEETLDRVTALSYEEKEDPADHPGDTFNLEGERRQISFVLRCSIPQATTAEQEHARSEAIATGQAKLEELYEERENEIMKHLTDNTAEFARLNPASSTDGTFRSWSAQEKSW